MCTVTFTAHQQRKMVQSPTFLGLATPLNERINHVLPKMQIMQFLESFGGISMERRTCNMLHSEAASEITRMTLFSVNWTPKGSNM